MSKQPEEPNRPEQAGLDERTGAFAVAAFHLTNAISHGEELRTRDMILRLASGVIWHLVRTMQYPRDQGLLPQFAWLTAQLTECLDQMVLNAEPDDKRLEELRKLAQGAAMWPTLVRPGDEKLTAAKIGKLEVGASARLGVPKGVKRPPSLATGRNRLALRLLRRIQNRTECILSIARNGGVPQNSSISEARKHLRVIEPEVPEREQKRLIKLLREARNYPFCAESLERWIRLVTEFVLIIDPHLERFPELKRVKSARGGKYIKTPEAKYRSELSKFLGPALKNLLG